MEAENNKDYYTSLSSKISKDEARKLIMKKKGIKNIWFGFGMFGLIGWSVVIPMLLGILLGFWIDSRYPSHYSWTLMLLVIGLMTGCLNAWHWIDKENKQIQKEEEDKNG